MPEICDGLKLETGNHISTLIIDRPERKNSVTHAMWEGITDTLTALRASDVRVIVVTGAGGNFSAGADIGEFDALRGDAAAARSYEEANSRAFRALRDAPVPVIAAIDGICFGGGFGIAAACDLRIGSTSALFSVPAAKLGLAYPADAMIDIVSSSGSQMARYLAYTAARISAAEAHGAGFLLEVLAEGGALTRALEIAGQIARNAPLSVRASKASIRAVISRNGEIDAEAARLGKLTFDSEDYAEGRRAFRERRTPEFKGR